MGGGASQAEQMASQRARRAAEAAAKQNKAQLTKEQMQAADIERGRQFALREVAPGSLGRVEEGISTDIQDVIKRRREGLSGLSSEELQGERDVAAQNIARAGETQRRRQQATQAATGVRGATAGAQLGDVAGQAIQQRKEFERDLFLRQADVKRQALQQFEASVTGSEATTLAKQQFNLQQAANEKFAVLSTGLGFAQLGVTERSAAAAAESQRQASAAQSSSCFTLNTLILLEDGSQIPICEARIGTRIKGGEVLGVLFAISEDMYYYNGIKVAGNHAVLENNQWLRVKDSKLAKKEDNYKPTIVCNLITSEHRIYTEGNTWADFVENDKAYNIGEELSIKIMNEEL